MCILWSICINSEVQTYLFAEGHGPVEASWQRKPLGGGDCDLEDQQEEAVRAWWTWALV